jgi:hypothetical protein
MDQKKLRNIIRQINGLYGSDRKSRELEGVAKRLGRTKVKHGAYTWENGTFPTLPPLSIPHHSRGLKRFTAEGILDQLQAQDVEAWRARLTAEAEAAANQSRETRKTKGETR